MKTVELFHLPGCPYCVKAGKVIDELVVRNPAYGGIEVKWIDESIETEYADTKDYYYVPTIFFGNEKLYEADPRQEYEDIKASIQAAFDKVLSAAAEHDFSAEMPQFTITHIETLLEIFDGLMDLEEGIAATLGWIVQPEGQGGKLYRVIDLLREISVAKGDRFHEILFAKDISNAVKAKKLMDLE